MEYINQNGYLIPNVTLKGEPTESIGKYGSLRLEFLRENDPMTFDEMTLEGTLYPHLLEIEKRVKEQIDETIEALKKTSPEPDRKSDPIGWTQYMNSLQAQAEELTLPMLYEL